MSLAEKRSLAEEPAAASRVETPLPPDTDPKHSEQLPPARPPLTKAEIRLVFNGLMLAGFLSAVNQTIVASALPTIGHDLGDLSNLSWVIISYLLSSTVVAPLYGKLSDIHGRRAMMLVAVGLFIAGSTLCAVAPNMSLLIVARTLQGVGGGGIVPIVQTTIADMVTPRERGHYQAYMGIAWISAGVVGPALGGIIADQFHWSLIFWLNVPLGLLAAMLVSSSMKRLPNHKHPHKLDMLGRDADDRRFGRAPACAHLWWNAGAMDVVADFLSGRGFGGADGRARLVAKAGA